MQKLQADTRGRWQHVVGYPLGESWSKYVASAEYATPGKGGALKNVTCYMGATKGAINAPLSEKGNNGTGPVARRLRSSTPAAPTRASPAVSRTT
jgi:hypothetical protein